MRDRVSIRETQEELFDGLIRRVLADNLFYRDKYRPFGFSTSHPPRLGDLPGLPFTTKTELARDQEANPPYGSVHSEPAASYIRLHTTSGTTGRPLCWLDTPESWQWLLDCWRAVYTAAGVGRGDRVFVAFSFGPFLGFWTAFEAAAQIGALAIPGGGLTSEQRLRAILELEATVLACTPTYALRLAEVARQKGLDLAASALSTTIHGGEPGASIPAVKSRLESAFGARCLDHAGATEVGPWGYCCGTGLDMHINERAFIAEVVDPDDGEPVPPDADGVRSGELVLSNLGRAGSPVLRYRTGDFVRLSSTRCTCGDEAAVIHGGVLTRLDDMMIVRGVNVYPSALEGLIREDPEIGEFEIRAETEREMTELVLRIEVAGDRPDAVARALTDRVRRVLSLRPRVELAPTGSLPRYELKARRFKRLDRTSTESST